MLGKYSKTIVLFTIMVGIIIIMSIFIPDKFLTVINFQSMASQIPEFGLLALAMMIAMMTGGIDLSVVSITNLTGVIAAVILTKLASPQMGEGLITLIIILAILAAIISSLVCGFLNGVLITYVGVPPILATLGTMGFFLGIAIVVTEGHGITGFPDKFLFIGSGTIWIIPVPLIIFIACALIVALVLNKTSLGLSIQMLGSNPVASWFAGINNNSILVKTYMITGLLAGISSVIMISRVNSMRPGYGYAYLLTAVLVIVLGGVNPSGGFGTVTGIIIGVIILQLLQSGFNILAFSPFFKKFIWGVMLLLVMVVNFIISKYQQRSRKLKIHT